MSNNNPSHAIWRNAEISARNGEKVCRGKKKFKPGWSSLAREALDYEVENHSASEAGKEGEDLCGPPDVLLRLAADGTDNLLAVVKTIHQISLLEVTVSKTDSIVLVNATSV